MTIRACTVRAEEGAPRDTNAPQHSQFVARVDSAPVWAPGLHEWVADTSTDRVGETVGWDGQTVTLRPPEGGEPWHTTTYRRATQREAMHARLTLENRLGNTLC
ncbi:hypothetical protein [Streptomyces sp. CT34]|uniref:hypothetical protein n=1 Tax=Streptomyces sp. CT34 TaxID=1553907 RepID=UPI0005BE738C|nr:hypothetical protein [Streptomyces sp. CT34]